MNNYEEINKTNSFLLSQNDNEKLLQENISLKSNNYMYKEDINNLLNINNNLREELENYKRKLFDLIKINESYEKEILNKNIQIEQLKNSLNEISLFNNFQNDIPMGKKIPIKQQIQEIKLDNKKLNEDNIKLLTENKFLNDKILTLLKEKDELCKQLNNYKYDENERINYLENTLKNFEKKLDNISSENIALKISNDKYLDEINLIKNENENLNEKLIRNKNKILEQTNINNNPEEININNKNLTEKETNKQKIYDELQNKIQKYKVKIKNLD